MYECMICNKYARRTLASVLRHIGEVHRFFEGVVKCGIEGCMSTARSYDSLRQHMYKKHKDILKQNYEDTNTAAPDDSTDCTSELVEESDNLYQLEDADDKEDANGIDKITDLNPSVEAAKFILKTRDGKKITQTTLNGVLQDTKSFIEYSVGQLEHEIIKILEDCEVNSEAISSIRNLLSLTRLRNPFEDLETERKQENFFQKHFNYVVSYC